MKIKWETAERREGYKLCISDGLIQGLNIFFFVHRERTFIGGKNKKMQRFLANLLKAKPRYIFRIQVRGGSFFSHPPPKKKSKAKLTKKKIHLKKVMMKKSCKTKRQKRGKKKQKNLPVKSVSTSKKKTPHHLWATLSTEQREPSSAGDCRQQHAPNIWVNRFRSWCTGFFFFFFLFFIPTKRSLKEK